MDLKTSHLNFNRFLTSYFPEKIGQLGNCHFPFSPFQMSCLSQNSAPFLPSFPFISSYSRKIEFVLVKSNLHLSIWTHLCPPESCHINFSLLHFLPLIFLLVPLSLPINILRSSPHSKDKATENIFCSDFPPKLALTQAFSFVVFSHPDLKSGKIFDFLFFFFLQSGSRNS